MKSVKLFTIILVAMLATACVDKQTSVSITNTADIDLVQKSFVIERTLLEEKLGALNEGEYAILKNGKLEINCQLDDIDNDGKWDELFGQVNLKAEEEKAYQLTILELAPVISYKTNIRLADKSNPPQEFSTLARLKSNDSPSSSAAFQMEGVAWENDVVGFRNYFDARNGMDIFGKRTTDMVLDSCGLVGVPTYHELQPWGMDILKVGNSLGAGAIALKTESGLYRVGPDSDGTFTLVKEGALRSIFDLDFTGMKIDDNAVNIKHRITIEAGKPYYNSEVWLTGIDGAKLVTGIVNMHSDSVYSKSNEKVSYFYTHDNQAYDGEKLGMAVLIPSNNIAIQTAPEKGEGIIQTFYTELESTKQPVRYNFMVGWEKQNAVFSTVSGFKQEIAKQAQQISAELTIAMQ